MTTPSSDPLSGTPYTTVAPLGRGGMGEVVEALHVALNRPVVVKLLLAHMADDARFVDRLRVEAQTLSAIESAHVVRVLDLGCTPAGRPYLVMERLQGRTLRHELEMRGPLPVAEAVEITRQILAGLTAAHAAGIIHRDIKLDNVFLCAQTDGALAPLVKVLDFGIVKVREDTVSRVRGPKFPTANGVFVGSPRTAAPEQIRFKSVDARTDVYTTGLLLYTLLTGRSPFAHEKDLTRLLNAQLLERPAPPSSHAPVLIPPALDAAVLRALEKQPEERFQSAEAFARALEKLPLSPSTPVDDGASESLIPTLAPPPPLSNVPPVADFVPRLSMGVFALITLGYSALFSLLAAVLFFLMGRP